VPFDFSSYQVAPGEKPASSAKFNNFLNAVQAGMNAMPPANILGYPADAQKFLNGGGGWTTPITDMAAVFVKATPTAVTGTTATDLFGNAFTIPAGRMGPNSAIKVWATGDYNPGGTARTIRLALALGAQTIWDSGASDPMPSSGSAFGWEFSAVIQNLGSLSAQLASGFFDTNNSANPATGLGKLSGSWAETMYGFFTGVQTSVNMAGGQTLKLIVTISGVAPTMTCKAARVEVTA
jgi:hypothetical protein